MDYINKNKVLVLGAGQAAMQVIDILLNDPGCQVVGCLDDNPNLQGKELFGVPVLGKMELLEKLWAESFFNSAIVGVGINLPVRQALYDRLVSLGVPLVNAIDPTVRINRQAVLGKGIVLCSFVHLGVCAQIEDNCFIGAHTSIDHHCHLGKTVFMGPGCLLSGTVQVGERSLFGDGVMVQLGLKIGKGCRIASGAIVVKDVPDHHSLKHRLNMELKEI
ncbi:hypothetical protein IJT10_03510 [bacterium]|nr:hypothetical protein [bacterium]